ncbi:MAG: T9SS type A sorting domain-containing protein, partial [Bacteroidetes bacterium]|nr:T9SS type A sorting domain-containing protein [Bacteroidota bacterium]
HSLLLTILFTLSFSGLFSQNTWKIYNQSNTPAIGPIHPYITDMAIDKDSTIWFATADGLSSLKNEHWQQYLFIDSCVDNTYTNIAIDNNNIMWLSSYGGVGGFYKYDIDNKKFSKIKNFGLKFLDLALDSSRTAWIATKIGLFKYENDRLMNISDAAHALEGIINAVHIDKTNCLWVGTEKGLLKYNGNQGLHYTDTSGLNSNKIAYIENDSYNNLWILTDKGLQKFENNKWKTINVDELNQKAITKMYIDNNDNIWFLTYSNGAYKYDHTKWEHFNTSNGLSDDFALSVIQDKKDNFWIGTDGVDFFDGISWKNYMGNIITHPDLLYYDNNKLWVTTSGGGYSVFDGKKWTTHNRATGFVSNHVKKIEKDKNGNIWIATFSKGIIKFDGENYTNYTDKNGITDELWCFFIDSKNNNWIGTSELGAAKFDGKKWTYFNSENSPLLNSVNYIFEDNDGNYWFATFDNYMNGIICRYDGENWKTFTPLDKGSVEKILQDRKGNIWFTYSFTDSVKNEIIVKYDGDRFDVISLSKELPEDTIFSDFTNGIYTIYEDNDSLLWFGLGEHGVLTYDGKNWKHLTKKEGFPWSGVRDIIQDDEGNYYFASDNQGVFKLLVNHNDIKTQVQKKAPFNVSPNPVKDVLHIKNENVLIKTTQVELYDINGKLLYTNYYHSNYELNMSGYPKGIYIVKLKYFNYVYTKKIVKE